MRCGTDTTIKIALYARVSTMDKGQDAEVQLRELRQYAALRGHIVSHEYVDVGVSGTKDSRPELDRMMKDAKTHAFDGVLVWRFDRFARSTENLLASLRILSESNVAFMSFTENADTSTPMGKFVMTILGAVAELERNILIERTRAGMRNAAAKGIHCGRPRKAR